MIFLICWLDFLFGFDYLYFMLLKIYIYFLFFFVVGEKVFKGGFKICFCCFVIFFCYIMRFVFELNVKIGFGIKENFNFFLKVDNY